MIPKKYQRKNADWWKGRKVITAEDVSNYVGTVSAGVVCTVYHKYSGLAIRTAKCLECGVSLSVRKVSFGHLIYLKDVLEVEYKKAIARAEAECAEEDMAVLFWDGRYLVVPNRIAKQSPYEVTFVCGQAREE